MKKRVYRKKKTTRTRSHLGVFHLLIFGLILAVIYVKVINNHPVQLAYLDIPQTSRVYLPSPLEFLPLGKSVLGTQAFDPVDVVRYVNIEREKVGSAPLHLSARLMEAAQMRADIILKYQNFSHQDPYENITMMTALEKLGYNYKYASENIGMGDSSGEAAVHGFMSSLPHKENLLNPDLSETGVALSTGPYREFYVNIIVQLFAIPGGRDEYLGYKKEDVEKYQNLLSEVDTRLHPVTWAINKILQNKDYTDEKYRKLSRQKEILAQILEKMREEKRLEDADVTLIVEYNQNLN